MECLACIISGVAALTAIIIVAFGPPLYYRLRYGNTEKPLEGKKLDDDEAV